MKIIYSSVQPAISKSAIPGGIMTFQENTAITPFEMIFRNTQDASGKNIIEKNIYCGDFLSFDYISREIPNISKSLSLPKDKKTIYNPLIIFSGYDPNKKIIFGVELRRFKISGLNSEAQQIFRIIRDYYYNVIFHQDGSQTYNKKSFSFVAKNPKTIFMYQYFSSGVFSKFSDILKKFYRSYNILSIKNCITFDIEKIDIFYNQTVKVLPGLIKE